MTAATERKIGRFQILKVLGRGTQGAVYLAQDPDLDRLVAVKLVADLRNHRHDDGSISPQARNLARLRHPNIIALHEAGRMHGFTYLVFEYLEGTVLREELESKGALPLAQAYSTIMQVVDAMAYAHARGILHLDLNPNNIMRDDAGRPRIVDFDLSRTVGAPVAETDTIAGTASYMAPEYVTVQQVDARADVYALGRIFLELLTGPRPEPAASNEPAWERIRDATVDLTPLGAVDAGGHFTEVIRRATARDPDQRYADAGRMREALVAAWAHYETAGEVRDAALHGTVAFVMKRIERRGDFPAVSRTLAEVNQLTSGDQSSPISRLTNVVLRDYALTSRLLKLANSAHYSQVTGRVKSVSDAITLLGVEQIRLTCNGLACFGHFAGRKQDRRLREESITAFVAGLIARHLAAQAKSREVEQAFLAGMLFTLGRMLALYYFTDDYEEMEALVAQGATEDEAARTVLGITLPEMGTAVGRAWGLPASVLEAMVAAPAGSPSPLRAMVRLAHALVEVDVQRDPEHAALHAGLGELRPHLQLDLPTLHATLGAALEKFRTFAPVLEVDVAQSPGLRRIEHWLQEVAPTLAQPDEAEANANA